MRVAEEVARVGLLALICDVSQDPLHCVPFGNPDHIASLRSWNLQYKRIYPMDEGLSLRVGQSFYGKRTRDMTPIRSHRVSASSISCVVRITHF